jgi:uncharacterized protein
MKYSFFLVIFILFFAAVTYVMVRGMQILPSKSGIRTTFAWSYAFLFLLFFGGLFLDHALGQTVSSIVTFVGYTFLMVVIYMLVSFLLVDMVRLSNHFTHFSSTNLSIFRVRAAEVSLFLIVIALIVGHYNFNHPKLVKLDITLEKPLQHKELKIVAASDIHLGNGIDKKRLKKFVTLINEQQPDIILLVGDITDRSIGPVTEQNMKAELLELKAPLGVYAIRGNHEYYSGKTEEIANYLTASGIKQLYDSTCLVDNSFYLIGRDDRTNSERKPLRDLVKNLDSKLPKILLDHQPYALEEAQQNGIDLQLSGHTHDGQFFPLNLVVRNMYEQAHGYLRKGNTQYYISSGLGIWGPQYRIGTQSELVVIRLKY